MPSLFDDTSSDSDSADEQASEPKNAKLKKKERSQKKSKQPVLTVNEEYAEKLMQQKRRAALSTKENILGLLEKELGYVVDESEDSTEEDEDEDAELLTHEKDVEILKTLAAIRKKDPSLLDPNARFYSKGNAANDESESGDESENAGSAIQKMSHKKFKVGDALRTQILEGYNSSDDESGHQKPKETSVQEQARLKKEFLDGVAAKEKEGADTLFSSSIKSNRSSAKKNKQALKSLWVDAEGANDSGSESEGDKTNSKKELDGDNFLKSFMINEWWKADDLSKIPKFGNAESIDDSEDENELDKQDSFESKYNFRFEEEGSSEIATFPRTITDSVRQTTSKRKRQREAKKERLKQEKVRKEEELKRLKHQKREEIKKKLTEIEMITGATSSSFGVSDLSKPFDPEDFDKRMKEIFDQEYYGDGDDGDEEKPTWDSDEEEKAIAEIRGKFESEEGGGVMKTQKYQREAQQKYLKAKARKLKSKDKEAALQATKDLGKKIDDLQSLDYEDLIAGKIKTKFRYIKTAACDYGMAIEEILNLTDKDLNQRVSLKKLRPYRLDASDNTPWFRRRGGGGARGRGGGRGRGAGRSGGRGGARVGIRVQANQATQPRQSDDKAEGDGKNGVVGNLTSKQRKRARERENKKKRRRSQAASDEGVRKEEAKASNPSSKEENAAGSVKKRRRGGKRHKKAGKKE